MFSKAVFAVGMTAILGDAVLTLMGIESPVRHVVQSFPSMGYPR